MRGVKRLPIIFLSLALLAVVAGTACAQTFGNTAAIVNGHRITQTQLDQELPVVRAGQGSALSDEDATRQALIAAIENELFREVAQQKHITPTAAQIDQRLAELKGQFPDEATFEQQVRAAGYTLATLRSDFVFNNLITRSLQTELAPPVTADQIQAVYNQEKSQFRQIKVKHILFAVSATKTSAQALKQANDTLAQLKNGADFATLAKKLTDDPGTKATGGVIAQWLNVSDQNLDQAFANAAWNATVGKLTGPVRSAFGYHIIVTLQKRYEPLTDVIQTASGSITLADQIKQNLEQQSGTRAITDFITALVKKAKIKVNPRYGDWDAATQSIVAHQFFRPAPGETPTSSPVPILSVPAPTASP